MGCDGGSIPRRRELVTLAKNAPKVDKTETEWSYDAHTNEPLKAPICADRVGRLYNLESCVQAVVDGEGWEGVRRRKDVTELKIEVKGECPIIPGKVMNGKYPFTYLATCGHVFSQQALSQIKSSDCAVCGKPYTSSDAIPLNPPPDVRAQLLANLATKKPKKRKAITIEDDADVIPSKKLEITVAQISTSLQSSKDRKAVQSLYISSAPAKKQTWATIGTFHRG